MRKAAILISFMMICTVAFCGCKEKEKDYSDLFPSYPPAEEVYIYNGGFSSGLAEREMLSALQGVVTRKTGKTAIYINLDANYAAFLEYLRAAYPDTTYHETNDLWSLFSIFSSQVTDMGYVLYKSKDANMSRNNAVTIASAEGYLICDESYTAKLQKIGYKQKADGSSMTQEQCFDAYKNKLNTDMIFHLHNTFDGTIDYCIANKNYMFAVEDSAYIGSSGLAYFEKVMAWADDNVPIFATGGNVKEDAYTSMVSVNGSYNIPAEWAQNLSVLSGLKRETVTPKYEDEEIQPKEGKHYMAFQLTDGDNVMAQMHQFVRGQKYYANQYRGEFPMTYGIAPTMVDLCTPVLDMYYDNMTVSDSFVCAPSGIGYVHPSNYNDMKFFAKATNDYMKRTGLKYVNMIDMFDPDYLESIDAFAEMDQIKGGFIATGLYYAGGNHSVYWSNGKPFVTIADALWDEISLEQSVKDLTKTAAVKDYRSVDGYSIVTVHAWSADLTMVYNVIDRLSNDIEIVTVNQLLDMVTKYVPKTNVTA